MTIVLSLVIIEFLNSSISQVRTSQAQIDRVKAEQLALGAFYRSHELLLTNMTLPTTPDPETLDLKTFTVTVPDEAEAGYLWAVNAINSITQGVTYP